MTPTDSVPCPVHGKPNMVKLVLDKERGVYVGICQCESDDKRWAGKPVVEMLKLPEPDAFKPATKEKS